MIESILVDLEIIRHIAEMRRAQKQGNKAQARILEAQVDSDLATIVNTLDRLKTGRTEDDLDLQIERWR